MALGICLVEQGVDSVNLLFHVLFSLLQSVAFALNVDNGAMVQHTVEDGGGDGEARRGIGTREGSWVPVGWRLGPGVAPGRAPSVASGEGNLA